MKNKLLIGFLIILSSFLFMGTAFASDEIIFEEGSEGFVLLGDKGFNLTLSNVDEEGQWLVANSGLGVVSFKENNFSEKQDEAGFLIKTVGSSAIACINKNNYINFNVTVLDAITNISINSDIKYPKIGDKVTYTVVCDDKTGFINAIWSIDGKDVYKGSEFTYLISDEEYRKLTVKVGDLSAEEVIKEKNNWFSFVENSAYGRLIAIGILIIVALCMILIRKKKPDLNKFADDGFKKICLNFSVLSQEIDKENNQKRIYKLFNIIDLNLSSLTNLLMQEDDIKINEFDTLIKEMQRKQNVINTAKRKYKKLEKDMLKRFFENNIIDFDKLKGDYERYYLMQKKVNRENFRNRDTNEGFKSIFSGFDLKYRESDKYFYEEYKTAAREIKDEKTDVK